MQHVYFLDPLPVIDVPLVIERNYRGGAGLKHTVTFRRRVACVCGFSGCPKCEAVGWAIRTASVNIDLSAGLDLGKRLVLPGQGDAMDTVSPGDLVVELVEEGERAEELQAKQRTREDAWEAARLAKREEARQSRRSNGKVLLGVMLVVLALVVVCLLVCRR